VSHFQIILYSIILVLLIIFAAFFSCAETGLMAVNRYRLRHQARLKKRYAIYLLQLLKRPDRLLGAILIGNTFANMLASSLATLIAFHFWGEHGALLAAVGLTFIVLIFAEIAPKTLAAIYPEKVSRLLVYPIQLILKLLYPAVWLSNAIANTILRVLRVKVTTSVHEPLTREELRTIVYDTTGKISRQYRNMLLGILDLSKLTVDDVMVPRRQIVGLNIEQSWEAIIDYIYHLEAPWSIVYRGHVNQLVGVLYVNDLIKRLLDQTPLNKALLQSQIKEPYYVPAGTSLNMQLDYFLSGDDKVAFVLDEYGEIQGLLTLNEILKEIVGDFTHKLSMMKRIQGQEEDGSYIVDGSITIREFNRVTGWDLPLRGPRTINGLIIEYLEALPHKGTAVLIANHPIEIIQVKENRVKVAKIFPRLSS
jgi:Mg2+/Co2+ transporter CorB